MTGRLFYPIKFQNFPYSYDFTFIVKLIGKHVIYYTKINHIHGYCNTHQETIYYNTFYVVNPILNVFKNCLFSSIYSVFIILSIKKDRGTVISSTYTHLNNGWKVIIFIWQCFNLPYVWICTFAFASWRFHCERWRVLKTVGSCIMYWFLILLSNCYLISCMLTVFACRKIDIINMCM